MVYLSGVTTVLDMNLLGIKARAELPNIASIIYLSGVTTVLTMTFLGIEARTELPQVSYPTALDFFVFISFLFIFTTVVQVRRNISGLPQ